MDVCHCSRFRLTAESLRYPPALLPIGGVRHKILTRSMRFLHILATGNHSRVKERKDMKQRWEADMREEDQEILQSLHFFCWDLVRKEWERSHEAAALTLNNWCLQWLPLRHCWRDWLRMQASLSRTFVVVKHNNKRLQVGDTLRDNLNFYFYMHKKTAMLE